MCEKHVVNEPVLITIRNIFFLKVHGIKVYEGLSMKGSTHLTHFISPRISRCFCFLEPVFPWEIKLRIQCRDARDQADIPQ